MGPNYSISTACATSNFCILNAANHIIRGEAVSNHFLRNLRVDLSCFQPFLFLLVYNLLDYLCVCPSFSNIPTRLLPD